MNYLGIDVGTGGTRALIIDSSGNVIASASAEHQHFASPRPGWAEQDPRDWWKACGSAVKNALQSSGIRAEDIACVGFSGQMHGAVLLDAADEVVRPAMIWCDQRSEAQSKELEDQFRARYADQADLQSSADELHDDQISLGARDRA